MKWAIIILMLIMSVLPISVISVEAQEEEVTTEPAAETTEPELPLAIQELLDKEMEKLPPVEKHFQKAQRFHATGKLEEAIQELELALKEDPEHVPSNCELGVIYMGQENYDKAIEQLEKTLGLGPGYPKTHYALANAYARKPEPDVELARKHLNEAIRLGYHPVPWFLDYMERLEGKKELPEGPGAEGEAEAQ